MKVKDCMRKNILFIAATDTIHSAAAAIAEHPHPSAIVIDGGSPIGVLSNKEILLAISENHSSNAIIKDLPYADFACVQTKDKLTAIASTKHNYWIVYEGESIAGLLQRSDFLPPETMSAEVLFYSMRPVMDSIEKPILAVDTQGTIRLCNTTAGKLIRLHKDDVLGLSVTSVFETFHPQTLFRGTHFDLSQEFRIYDRRYSTNWAPIRIEKELVGAFAILQETTEYDCMSSELERVKVMSRELNAIIDSSFDGIYLTDGESRTIRVNKAYERITGIKSHEVVGKTMKELIKSGFYNESATLRVLREKQPVTIVQNISKTNKTIVVTGNPIFDDKGDIFRVVNNVRDVTELNQLQKKLKKMELLQSRYETELQQIRKKVDEQKKYVIKSKKMNVVYETALKLANVDSTILIQGESGVGKEVFSEIVHSHGARRKKPFIKISCAAIPENLLDSELFGYEPGSFTGANRKGRAGIFELGHGGTIFLDEIGELPIALQVKLLRVLQQKEITRIGSSKPIKVDNRIMAATNRDLEKMVSKKQFRKDLFFRLNVVPVVIPPLRERKEAISSFIYFFLEKYNRKYGFSKQIATEIIDAFVEYDWPGNVRELENMIERLVVLAQGEILSIDNLPGKLKSSTFSIASPFEGKSLKEAIGDFERKILTAAIEKYQTSRKIAAALGVNQSTIIRKASRHGISMRK